MLCFEIQILTRFLLNVINVYMFICSFIQMLNEIGNIINTIDQECVSVADRLRHASIQTESLLQHAEALQNEKSILESKIWISTHFMNKFQLSPDEQETYNNCMRSSDVSQEFFRILEKLAQIRNDSRQLLKYSQQKLG